MNSFIDDLVNKWKNAIYKNTNLEKLWDYFDIYIEHPSQLIIKIKEEWKDYFNVYQLIISPSKIEFEQTENVLAPYLILIKHQGDREYTSFDSLKNIDDIMIKIEEFSNILPLSSKEKV